MRKRTTSKPIFVFVLILANLFLSGCSSSPFLTSDGSYEIITTTPTNLVQTEPIELPWNTNMAIMQKLLLESSFVLSDLHTPSTLDTPPDYPKTTMLQANYPEPKRMTFSVDDHTLTLDVRSLQIEVGGANVGRVILNQTLILQGINNPNLQPAFEALTNMLHKNAIKEKLPHNNIDATERVTS